MAELWLTRALAKASNLRAERLFGRIVVDTRAELFRILALCGSLVVVVCAPVCFSAGFRIVASGLFGKIGVDARAGRAKVDT